jgi:hypothetical protein
MPDVAPQVAGLVLADDVLMLAQAAAGDGDLVEWISEAIRMRATPRASTLAVQAGPGEPAPAGGTDQSRAEYMREYMRAKRAAKRAATKPVTPGG